MSSEDFFRELRFDDLLLEHRTIWNIDERSPLDTIPRYKVISDNSIFTIKDLNKMMSIDLSPTMIRVFRWAPNTSYPWHIDGNVRTREVTPFAINWVLTAKGKIEFNTNVVFPTPSDTDIAYMSTAGKNSKKLGHIEYSAEIVTYSTCCILDTSIPHRVVNDSDIHRITVSVLFDKTISYADAVERLKSIDMII